MMASCAAGEGSMGPLKAASLALAVCLVQGVQGEAPACDSYADEASLASVLARAVAEARANGGLEAQASPHLPPAEVGPERAPQPAPATTSPAGAGAVITGTRQPASSSL